MADHTQLPWRAKPAERYGDGFSIGNDDSNAAFVPGFQDHPHIRANADLIVKAVNCHVTLMEALSKIREIANGPGNPRSLLDQIYMAATTARRATLPSHKGTGHD